MKRKLSTTFANRLFKKTSLARKFLSLALGLALIFPLFAASSPSGCAWADNTRISFEEWEKNSLEAGAVAGRFNDHYFNASTDSFPDFFGGGFYSDDGTLTFCLTDDSPERIAEIQNVCQSTAFKVKKVERSFSELQTIADMIFEDEAFAAIARTYSGSIFINVEENRVDFYAQRDFIPLLQEFYMEKDRELRAAQDQPAFYSGEGSPNPTLADSILSAMRIRGFAPSSDRAEEKDNPAYDGPETPVGRESDVLQSLPNRQNDRPVSSPAGGFCALMEDGGQTAWAPWAPAIKWSMEQPPGIFMPNYPQSLLCQVLIC